MSKALLLMLILITSTSCTVFPKYRVSERQYCEQMPNGDIVCADAVYEDYTDCSNSNDYYCK